MNGSLLTLHMFVGMVGDIFAGIVMGMFDHYIMLLAAIGAAACVGFAIWQHLPKGRDTKF